MYVRKGISIDFSWEGNEDKRKRYENFGTSMVDVHVG